MLQISYCQYRHLADKAVQTAAVKGFVVTDSDVLCCRAAVGCQFRKSKLIGIRSNIRQISCNFKGVTASQLQGAAINSAAHVLAFTRTAKSKSRIVQVSDDIIISR